MNDIHFSTFHYSYRHLNIVIYSHLRVNLRLHSFLNRNCSIVKLESIGKDRTMDLPLYCAVFDKNDSCVPCPYNSFNNFLYVFTFVFY